MILYTDWFNREYPCLKGIIILNNKTEATTHKRTSKLESYNKNLQLLVTKLSLAEERDRIKITNEIHDGIGQMLVLCNIRLTKIILLSQSDDLTQKLIELKGIIKETLNETRNLIFEISPPSLNHIGLEAALNELVRRVGEKYYFCTSFEDDGQIKVMNEDVRILLFQMVRELLVNISKHANAQNVKVSIFKRAKTVRITVTDDGIGFDEKILKSKKTKGIGFFSIRERISQIGGSLEIASKKGSGTRITLVAPLITE